MLEIGRMSVIRVSLALLVGAGETFCGNLYASHGNVALAHAHRGQIRLVYVGRVPWAKNR